VNLNETQPPPKPGKAPHTIDLVVGDLWQRKQFGIAKYGRAHQWDNGRDHLVDGYQEVLDLACYLRSEIERRRSIRAEALEEAAQLLDRVPGFACGADVGRWLTEMAKDIRALAQKGPQR
jgi:hypothetical protein